MKYEYDAAGRLVKEGTKSYSYGYLDKVLSVYEDGEDIASFTYHMDGQIATAKTKAGTESFLWDGLALISRNETEYVNEPYVTGGNPILANDKVLFNDMLGTTLGIINGDQVTQNNLSAFGESFNALSMQDSFFTGKPHVKEIGYAFLFRNYRPDQGKWLTQDPLGYPDGWNNFAYVRNGVIYSIDIYGCVTWDTLAQGALGVLGGGIEIVASIALVANPTVPGVSQTLGVIGFMDGLGRIGLGIANITKGILDQEAGPADYIEVAAMIAGELDPSSQETYDSIATAINLALGQYLPGAESKIIENGMKIFDGYAAIDAIIASLKKIHGQIE